MSQETLRYREESGLLPRPHANVSMTGSAQGDRWLVSEINEWIEAGLPRRSEWEQQKKDRAGLARTA